MRSPKKYFNHRPLDFSPKFATNYLFFAHSLLQQKNLQDQIDIALKNVTGRLKAGFFLNYEENIKRFLSSDQGSLFIKYSNRLEKVS